MQVKPDAVNAVMSMCVLAMENCQRFPVRGSGVGAFPGGVASDGTDSCIKPSPNPPLVCDRLPCH